MTDRYDRNVDRGLRCLNHGDLDRLISGDSDAGLPDVSFEVAAALPYLIQTVLTLHELADAEFASSRP